MTALTMRWLISFSKIDIALQIDNVADRVIGQLKAKTIIALGREFDLNNDAVMMAIAEIYDRLEAAKQAIIDINHNHRLIENKIIQFMEKRWKGTFSLIGRQLSKKQ